MSGPEVGVIRFSSAVAEAEFIIPTGARHAGIGDGQHRNTVLIAVADVADVHAGRREINDVAGNRAMGEVQITQAGIGQSSSEVILRCDADCFQGGRASSGAVGEQHLFSATNQLAVDEGVAQVKAEGLERTSVGKQLEAAGVAVLEDQRGGLVRVGRGRQSAVIRSVVHAGKAEIDGRNFSHRSVNGTGAASTGHLVTQTINVVVDGDAVEACADRRVGDAGGGNNRLA